MNWRMIIDENRELRGERDGVGRGRCEGKKKKSYNAGVRREMRRGERESSKGLQTP